MGGSWYKQLFGTNPELSELENIALEHLKTIMKIEDEPVKVIAKIHEKCIAQYTVGHAQRVQKLRNVTNELKLPIAFIGSSYDGVSINDTIMSSKTQINTQLLL